MKVIINNYESNLKPKRVICEHCNSILEIMSNDIKQVEVRSYDPRENESFKYKTDGFTCPCCNKDTKIVLAKEEEK